MALNKRTQAQRAADLVQIENLHLRGKTQIEIAEIISSQRPYTLSRQQVDYDLRSLTKSWLAEATAERNSAMAKELATIKALQAECWAAWEQSKSERTKARQETGGKGKDGKATVTKASMEKEQRDGNPAFLQAVLSCIDRRCKLLGLDAPTKQEVTGKDGGPIQAETTTKPDLSKLGVDELLQLRQIMTKATDGTTNAG